MGIAALHPSYALRNPHARKSRIAKPSQRDLPCPVGTEKINRFCFW
jgi:hypothetical protein